MEWCTVGTCMWLVGSYYLYNKKTLQHVRLCHQVEWFDLVWYSLLLFVASSTCLSFIVAIVAVMGLFYICFCQRQVIAAVRSCPTSLLVLSILFRFSHSLPGKLSHGTPSWLIVIIFVWWIERPLHIVIFCCQVVAIVLAFESIIVFALVARCLLQNLSSTCSIGWGNVAPFVGWGWRLHCLTGVAQSILIDHPCHCQIASITFPKTSTIGWN